MERFPGHTNPPPPPTSPIVNKSCRISIKDEFTKDLFALFLKYFDDLYKRGFKRIKAKRYDLYSGKIKIEYVFEKN